jgi:hypothetical protein
VLTFYFLDPVTRRRADATVPTLPDPDELLVL